MTVRFASTEAGLHLLQGNLRHFLRGIRAANVLPGRIHYTTLGSNDPRDLALQATFLRLVSVAEATVDTLAVELTARTVPPLDEVLRLLVLEKELAGSSSWEARRRSYKRHHGVDLQKCRDYALIEGAIEVRNSVAHGLGRLTTRQILSTETARKLARISVIVVNDFVRLETQNIKECADYCATFLRSLDASVS
jgi:hypothetical protein